MTPEQCKKYNSSDKSKKAKKEWRQSVEGKKYHAEYHKKYSAEYKERKAELQRIRRKTSSAQILRDKKFHFEYCRRPETKTRKNVRRNSRRQIDIGYRLTEKLRGRMKDLLKRDRPESVSRSMGCTGAQLKSHLESKFLPGMTWENHGLRGWHIDHIKPLALFDLTDLEQYRQACHYTNLQPLWAIDNLKKGVKYEEKI